MSWLTTFTFVLVLSYAQQFNRYDPVDGRITERDFADILLLYAGLPDKKRVRMLKKVRKVFKNDKVSDMTCVWLLWRLVCTLSPVSVLLLLKSSDHTKKLTQ